MVYSIVTYNQLGADRVSVSEWTMQREEARQVAVVGKEDKSEITVVLSVAELRA